MNRADDITQKGTVFRMADADNKAKLLPDRQIAAFAAQLALILRSGLPLRDGIALMQESGEDADMPLSVLMQSVTAGGSLRQALGKAGGFPDYMLGMVEIGERSGKLEEVARLKTLQRYLQAGKQMPHWRLPSSILKN